MSVSPLSPSSSRIRSAGLVSGLDTEEIVKQMSALSKQRLNTQKQKLQTLQWKQVEYRKSISALQEFKDKYFNLLKPDTNIGSAKLFGARSVTSSNALLKLSAAANATEGTFNITDIIRKAESASIASTDRAIDGVTVDLSTVEGTNYNIKVNLDGLEKTISFTGGATNDLTKQNILDSINTAFDATKANFSFDGDRLTVSNTEIAAINHTFVISEASNTDLAGLKALGFEDPVTNKISLNTKLEDISFKTDLKGNGFTFDINGKSFAFNKDTTLGSVINTINSSDAGVKLSYDSVKGQFSLGTIDSGAGTSLNITQKSGNLLTAMFGADKIAEASSISSSSLMSNGIQGKPPAADQIFAFSEENTNISELINQSIGITVNGVEKKIALWSYNSAGVKNDFTKGENVVSQLNSELTRQFGVGAPTFSFDKDAKTFTLMGGKVGDVIKISALGDVTGGSAKLVSALGFDETNSTNEIDINQKLFEGVEGPVSATLSFGGGNTITINENTTLKELLDGSFGNITLENNSLKLNGIDMAGTDEGGRAYLSSLFGEEYNYPGVPPANVTPFYEANGQNAIMTYDGNTITSNSNTFTINGTSVDISALEAGATNISVTTASDTTAAMKTIKSFVEDYNNLIDALNGQVSTKHDKDYDPLTDEEREDMSDKEVELWEEKAKTGLLYQDSTISRIMIDLRSSISAANNSGFTLYNIGIKPSLNYKDNGKLEIDETKLQKALNENSDAVSKLFTDTNNGLSASVTNALDRAVATTGANKGTLVVLAGVENTSTTAENRISKQIDTYKDLIEDLQDRYESEQERYWRQFTTLEKTMNSYNSQSSWLSSQFQQ